MSKVRVFASFDVEHDRELYELLLEQSQTPSSSFGVVRCSERSTAADPWSEKVRRRIREADQMIVICGEHTESSIPVSAELRIAQEEGTPYFLIWGRREMMCTKPNGAKPAEGMFSWTRQILENQIALTLRSAHADEAAKTLRNTTPKGSSSPSGAAP